jgi:hypothetical protein
MSLIETEAVAAAVGANGSLQEVAVTDGHAESSGDGIEDGEGCVKYRTLGIYLSTSAVTYLSSVLVVVLVRLAMAPFKRRMQQAHTNASRAAAAQRRGLRAFGGLAGGLTHSNGAFALPAGADGKKFVPSEPSMYSSVQDWAGDLISGNNATGRFLVVFAFCCSIASFLIYVYGKLLCLDSRSTCTFTPKVNSACTRTSKREFSLLVLKDRVPIPSLCEINRLRLLYIPCNRAQACLIPGPQVFFLRPSY